jgi:hypothetical protein
VESLKLSTICFWVETFLIFSSIKILHWLGVYVPLSNVVGDHTSQFCDAYVFRKEFRSGLRVVWLTCCWILWKERNSGIFTCKVSSVEMLFDKVKSLSWWRLKSRKKDFSNNLNVWWLNPLHCLGY